eukprot:gene6417-6912_t
MPCNVLYIQEGIEEKYSAEILYQSAKEFLPFSCCFTVVRDAFAGLECVQFHSYDILYDLNIYIPIILLTDPKYEDGYVCISHHPVFVLPKPFTSQQLCDRIHKAVNISSTLIVSTYTTESEPFLLILHPELLEMMNDNDPVTFEERQPSTSRLLVKDEFVPQKMHRADLMEGYRSFINFHNECNSTDLGSVGDSHSEFSGRNRDDEEDDSDFLSFANEPMLDENEKSLQEWREILGTSSDGICFRELR